MKKKIYDLFKSIYCVVVCFVTSFMTLTTTEKTYNPSKNTHQPIRVQIYEIYK